MLKREILQVDEPIVLNEMGKYEAQQIFMAKICQKMSNYFRTVIVQFTF